MIIKKSGLLIFYVFLFTLSISPQKKNNSKEHNNPLIGKWATVMGPGEKSRTILDFKPDGKVEYDITVPFSGSYFSVGNTVITYFKDPQKAATEVDTSTIKIIGDTLYQVSKHNGNEIIIKSLRLHKEKKETGLTGKWISENFNGHKAIQEFTKQNSINVDLIVRSVYGTYIVSGNTFTLNLQLMSPLKTTYKIKNNVMTIERYDKKGTTELIKVDEY